MTFRSPVTAVLSAMLAGLVPSLADAGEYSSTYTRHDYERCAPERSSESGIVEVRRCAGLGGIPVIWTAEPDASAVEFGMSGGARDLDLGGFFEAGSTIEWRGPTDSAAIDALAAIVRYRFGPSVGQLNRSRLVVYRVHRGRAGCIMGSVPGEGPDANAAARAMVDRHAAGFACGRSPRIAANP